MRFIHTRKISPYVADRTKEMKRNYSNSQPVNDEELPEPLRGLGITKYQLKYIRRYFAVRVRQARKQRNTVIWLCLILFSMFDAQPLPDKAGVVEPAGALLNFLLFWLPIAALLTGAIALSLSEFIAYHLRKRIPDLGVTQRAAEKIADLGDSMANCSFFGKGIGKS